MCTVLHQLFSCTFLTEAVFSFIRVIRELATKALHNLTIQAPEYMANTGEKPLYDCKHTANPTQPACFLSDASNNSHILKLSTKLLIGNVNVKK